MSNLNAERSSVFQATRGVRGVVMAGGRSERMRATNGPEHKALVQIAGVPMLERALLGLFSENITDVVVVISAAEVPIGAYLGSRGNDIARRFGATLETYEEREPLGNIGVVGVLGDGARDLFIVYVDNLTSISAREVLLRHRTTSAALTIATHVWPLRNPFGELDVEAGYVRSYTEKPVRKVRISSGTCVVSPAAALLVPAGRPFGAADLCAAALAASLPIAAYEHEELWIDVNDAPALAQAQMLLESHPERFAS